MNDEPLISVIVPVYNVAQYLDACLESIVSQSYRHMEILVVDDGSTDNSGALCDHWADRDERIRVIHQPNGGLSAARNTAIDVMGGQWVTMVDSDDVLHPEAVATWLDLAVKYGADIAVGGYRPFVGDALQWTEPATADARCYSQDEAVMAVFYQHDLTHSAWGRLYRAALFSDVRYPAGMYYEDLAVIYPLLKQCSLVVKTDSELYGYRQRENSILETFSPRRAHVLDIGEKLETQMQQEGSARYLKAVRSRLLSAYFNILLLSHQDKETRHEALQARCWNGIKRLRHGCLLDRHVRLKNKAGIVASWMGRRLLCDFIGRDYHPSP